MKARCRRRRKYRSLLAVGILSYGSSGCIVADNPGYLFAQGVGNSVLGGVITVTSALILDALFPGIADDTSE